MLMASAQSRAHERALPLIGWSPALHTLSLVPASAAPKPDLVGSRGVLAALIRQHEAAGRHLADLNAAQQRLEAAAREVADIEGEYAALEAREAAELRAWALHGEGDPPAPQVDARRALAAGGRSASACA